MKKWKYFLIGTHYFLLSLGILIIYKITLLIFCSEYEVQLYFQDHILNNHEAESKIALTFLF